ncbi:MAG: hypothetical protein ABFC24_03760 [Methanoregulaceae archaeon]
MDVVSLNYVDQWYASLASVLPAVIGAILVLIIGWIAGRLLGKGVNIVLDRIASAKLLAPAKAVIPEQKSKITIGYIGNIIVRCVVYLVAIVAATDILHMEMLSNLVTGVITYIPHIVAFILIFVVGLILVDYFIDFLERFYANASIELIRPVLMVFRIFLYVMIVILALSQLMLDLTIVYTFITPVAWGIGLAVGTAIAVIIGFGLKNRSGEIMDNVLGTIQKK